MTPLDVFRTGAVTPVGLSGPTTCAAVRAGVKALQTVYHPTFPTAPVSGGKVPSSIRLRRSYGDWLVNLATRAIAEAMEGFEATERTALIVNLPEAERGHPDLPPGSEPQILTAIQRRLGVGFHSAEAIRGGHSGVLGAIARGRQLIESGTVTFCCIGGVDSMVNGHDINRLRAESRLKDEHHPFGVMPSEGAAFFVIGPVGAHGPTMARILGVGLARTGGVASATVALREAMERALSDAGTPEAAVSFVVTDYNGERERAFDYMIAEMRTFRTIRASMPRWSVAESVGDTNAAAGALAVLLAAAASANGYAPGRIGVCATSSDGGSHAACVIQMISEPDVERDRVRREAMAVPAQAVANGHQATIPDVVRQHNEETASLFALRAATTRARHLALSHLRTLDDRLSAHMDALALGGDTAWRFCMLALEAPSPARIFPAAVLAFCDREGARLDQLFALAEAVPQLRPGLSGASGWLEPNRLRGTIASLLAADSGVKREVGVATCAIHRVDPGLVDRGLMNDADASVRTRAVRAAGELGIQTLLPVLLSCLDDDDPDVAFWSAWSATLAGDRGRALQLLTHVAISAGAHNERARLLSLQAMGTAAAHEFLDRFKRESGDQARLIEGAALGGDPAYVPWFLHLMEEHSTARRAGEAFALITGVDIEAMRLAASRPEGFEERPNDNPDDENVDVDPDEGLPWPDPQKVEAWWAANSHRFQKGTRYFMGAPVTREHCIDVLKNGYQRQRILAAHYLCLLEPGTPLFNTSAPAWRQQRLLAAM